MGEIITKNIRIMFWNCKSLSSNRWDLYRNLQQFDIIICVETWLTEKDEIQLPGFSCLRRDLEEGEASLITSEGAWHLVKSRTSFHLKNRLSSAASLSTAYNSQ
ncbi:hypothetical protein TKK_0016602 [Trichogramma kaykai]